ncbi:MAG: biopolymer transporter ExbD [Myxococcales bacterium]
MAGSSSGGGDDEMIAGINVTPLVDVVLVLLIILMVTAQYVADKDSIPMELPKAASGESAGQPSTLSVSIDKDGRFYLDAQELTLEQMRERVRAAYAKDHDTRAVIAADGRVNHAMVVKAIDLLRQEKVTKFAINVRPEDLASSGK